MQGNALWIAIWRASPSISRGYDAHLPIAWASFFAGYFTPPLTDAERATVDREGWILGVT